MLLFDQRKLVFVVLQFGSYFGAALCVVDVNDDDLDDLLVGAPLYHGKHGDEGKVYVYINHDHVSTFLYHYLNILLYYKFNRNHFF